MLALRIGFYTLTAVAVYAVVRGRTARPAEDRLATPGSSSDWDDDDLTDPAELADDGLLATCEEMWQRATLYDCEDGEMRSW